LVLLVGLAFLLFLDVPGGGNKKKKRGGWMKVGKKGGGHGLVTPSWILTLLGVMALLTLIFGGIATYGFLQPTESVEPVERLNYEHLGYFLYSVHVDPSILNSGEIIGPVGPGGPDDVENDAALPIFTRLARSLDLEFTYRLASALPPQVSGEIGADLQVKAGEIFIKNEPLVPLTNFDGSEASVHASVDFREIQDFIEIVEEQTGFVPGTYEIFLVPKIHIAGIIDGTSIDETYAPPFKMTMNQTQIVMDTELARTELKTIEDQVPKPNEIRLLNLSIPVMYLRLLGLTGGLFFVLLTGILAAFLYFGLGMDESVKLKARYGSMIVSVSASELGSGENVQVSSMQDLVQLARKDGSVIFHQEGSDGSHLYFIPNGRVIYTYSVGSRKVEN
jgi:hypothetical protein